MERENQKHKQKHITNINKKGPHEEKVKQAITDQQTGVLGSRCSGPSQGSIRALEWTASHLLRGLYAFVEPLETWRARICEAKVAPFCIWSQTNAWICMCHFEALIRYAYQKCFPLVCYHTPMLVCACVILKRSSAMHTSFHIAMRRICFRYICDGHICIAEHDAAHAKNNLWNEY